MHRLVRFVTVVVIAVGSILAVGGAREASAANLVNGSFEAYGPAIGGAGNHGFVTDTDYAGWRTTDGCPSSCDGQIEVWGSNWSPGGSVPSYDGDVFVELNAYTASTLYQDVSGISAGSTIGYQFAHRGRYTADGPDDMNLTITDLGPDNTYGTSDDTALFSYNFLDYDNAWGFYTGVLSTLAPGDTIRFAFTALSSDGGLGDPSSGNFLDDVAFGLGIGSSIPEPASLTLLGLAVLGLRAARGRKRS